MVRFSIEQNSFLDGDKKTESDWPAFVSLIHLNLVKDSHASFINTARPAG